MKRHLLLFISSLVFIPLILVWANTIHNNEYLIIRSGDTLSEIAYRKKIELQLNEKLEVVIKKFLINNKQIQNPNLIIANDRLKNPYYTLDPITTQNVSEAKNESEIVTDLPYQYKLAAGYYFAKHTTKFGQSQINLASDYWVQVSSSVIIPWNKKLQSEIKLTLNQLKYLFPVNINLNKTNSLLIDLELSTNYELNNYLNLNLTLSNRQKNFLSNLGSSQFKLNKENIQTIQPAIIFDKNSFYLKLNQAFLIGSSDINFKINSFQATEIVLGHKRSKKLGIELSFESAYAKTNLNSTTENLLGARIYGVF